MCIRDRPGVDLLIKKRLQREDTRQPVRGDDDLEDKREYGHRHVRNGQVRAYERQPLRANHEALHLAQALEARCTADDTRQPEPGGVQSSAAAIEECDNVEDAGHHGEHIHGKPALEVAQGDWAKPVLPCLLYTSPSPRDQRGSRMPSSA